MDIAVVFLENADVLQSCDKQSAVNQASSFDEKIQTFKLSCNIYFFDRLMKLQMSMFHATRNMKACDLL